MKRVTSALKNESFDLVVIGGGIYGAFCAWDASMRGLKVALIEKEDFGCATSANSQKIVHGGFRYLQNFDLKRMRESIRERRAWLRIAPGLVRPLPVLMPTYKGAGLRSKPSMTAAMMFGDLIAFDRNRGISQKGLQIPSSKALSKKEALRLVPGIEQGGLTGAAMWCDAQITDSERLTFSVVQAAVNSEVCACNYIKACGFQVANGAVVAVKCKDGLTGDEFDIQTKFVINAAGPWIQKALDSNFQASRQTYLGFSKAINLVVDVNFGQCAVAFESKAASRTGKRLFFVTPWNEQTIIGTSFTHYSEDIESPSVSENEIDEFLLQVNESYPAVKLSRKNITFVHVGLLPITDPKADPEKGAVDRHYQIWDHEKRDQIKGVLSILGVKYTTARDVASKTVDKLLKKMNLVPVRTRTDVTKLPQSAVRVEKSSKDFSVAGNVLATESEVVRVVENEMAVRLADVIFRRTNLAEKGYPGNACLQRCADIMAEKLGWSAQDKEQEIQLVHDYYARLGLKSFVTQEASAS